jgi:hypothetical protein
LRAIHGNPKSAVYYDANLKDCGYLIEIGGRRSPGLSANHRDGQVLVVAETSGPDLRASSTYRDSRPSAQIMLERLAALGRLKQADDAPSGPHTEPP